MDGMSNVVLKLDWCSAEAAGVACKRWHYSRTRPTGKNNHIGVWEDGKFIGCVIFGSGASPGLGKPYGLEVFGVCELVRVALANHASPVSRIVSIALRMMKNHNPGLRLVVSFADPFQGHAGIIYQAMGWIYSGQSSPSKMIKLPDGSMAHERRFSGQGWNAPQPIPVGSKIIKTLGKHRYLMPLDAEMRAKIENLRKPYPKRAGSADSGTGGIQPQGGGATPTPALTSVA